MSDLDHTVALLDRLIAYPSISTDSNLALIDDLATRLETVGARCEVFGDTTGSGD